MFVLTLQRALTRNDVAAIAFVVVFLVPLAAGFVSGVKWRWLKATTILLFMTGALYLVAVAALTLWVADCPDCVYSGPDDLGDRADQLPLQVILLTLAAIYSALASAVSASVGRWAKPRMSRLGERTSVR